MSAPNRNRVRRLRRKANARKRKLFEKVICQKDYLSCICVYLTVQETFASVPAVSKFHHKFLQDSDQKHLLYQLLSYETWGKNITFSYSNLRDTFESPSIYIGLLFLLNAMRQICTRIVKESKI